MLDLDDALETDVHFEHVILDRLLHREAANRIDHAWDDAPAPLARRGDERATWAALHEAMRRLARG